jgi:ATP-binding cassette subfamily B protein
MTVPGPQSGTVSGNPAAPAHVNRNTARRVVPLFRPYKAQVTAVVGLIVVTSTIGIINPLLIQKVFNEALFVPGGPNLQLLVILVAIMAVVPIVNGAIGILQTYETTRVGQLVMRDLRDRLYAHLQTLPLAFFTSTKTGEIQSRLANDVGGVQSVVTTTASTILANVVIFVSTVVAMVILSWQLTIVALITVPAFFWLTKTVGERRRQVARSTQESLAAMSALSEETLSVSGVLLAKAFGNQARDTTRYHQENQRLADLEVRQQMIGQGFYAIVQSFLSITPAAVYLIAGLLLAHSTAISAAPWSRSPRCRPACTSRSGSCCRYRWSCDRPWPYSTGSSSTWTWCPTSSMPPMPSICR